MGDSGQSSRMSDVFSLISLVVCLSVAYIGPKSRTERPRKTKTDTEVAHVTCDSDTTYQVTSKVKVTRPIYSPQPKHKADAAVIVRTYWAWETTATLHLLSGARGAWAPTGEERGGGISCRHAHSLLNMTSSLAALQPSVQASAQPVHIDG